MKALLRALPYGVVLLSLALPATRTLATITGSGEVRILVDDPQIGFVTKSPGIVEPDDEIQEIEIGDPGPLDEREEGSLTLTGEGTAEAPRSIGDAFVRVGSLELVGVFLTGRIFAGTGIPDEGLSSVSISLFSEVGRVSLARGGSLTCQSSVLAQLSVQAGASAFLAGCNSGWIDASPGSQVEILGGTFPNAAHNAAGDFTLRNATVTAFQTDVLDGTVEFENVVWSESQDFEAQTLAEPLVFTVRGSTVTAPATTFRGSQSAGRPQDTSLVGDTVWTSADFVRVWNDGPFDVVLGARLAAGGDLDVSGAGTVLTVGGEGDGSRIDVAGDATLRFFSVLNVEDGGVVDVDGTLTIEDGTTVNLNGGTLRVGALVEEGTLVENGGVLIVPEAGHATGGAAALGTLAWRARRRA